MNNNSQNPYNTRIRLKDQRLLQRRHDMQYNVSQAHKTSESNNVSRKPSQTTLPKINVELEVNSYKPPLQIGPKLSKAQQQQQQLLFQQQMVRNMNASNQEQLVLQQQMAKNVNTSNQFNTQSKNHSNHRKNLIGNGDAVRGNASRSHGNQAPPQSKNYVNAPPQQPRNDPMSGIHGRSANIHSTKPPFKLSANEIANQKRMAEAEVFLRPRCRTPIWKETKPLPPVPPVSPRGESPLMYEVHRKDSVLAPNPRSPLRSLNPSPTSASKIFCKNCQGPLVLKEFVSKNSSLKYPQIEVVCAACSSHYQLSAELVSTSFAATLTSTSGTSDSDIEDELTAIMTVSPDSSTNAAGDYFQNAFVNEDLFQYVPTPVSDTRSPNQVDPSDVDQRTGCKLPVLNIERWPSRSPPMNNNRR